MKRDVVNVPGVLGALFLLAGFSLNACGRRTADAGAPPSDIKDYFVSTSGSDRNPGTKAAPFATLARAQQAVRSWHEKRGGPASVRVRGGTYYLDRTLVLGAEDSGSPGSPVVYAAYPGERVTVSGGRLLACRWQPDKDGTWKCDLPAVRDRGLRFTQLFVDGKRQVLARFPNRDESRPGQSGYIHPAGRIPDKMRDPRPGLNDDMTFSGAAPRGIIFDPATFPARRWARPEEAVIHIFQAWDWGNLQWRLKAIDYDSRAVWFGAGGFQMGAKWDSDPARVDEDSRFYIENVFEEMDAPGEWYLDVREGALYFMPPAGLDLAAARVEVPVLERTIAFAGSQDAPVHDVVIEGFRFAHTTSTFLEPYDVPSLSDWAVHRGGAVLFDGARDCGVKDCWFDAVGGNAVFVNNYNRRVAITGCLFTESGDSAVCLVGTLGLTNGTRRSFPFECTVSNNLIHDCGVFGKQIAGVYISRAKRITAAHNTIYNMPRAGICIGDGAWGGHIVEYNHIHDTVRETGDHGPFNAWGRERFWSLTQSHSPYSAARSLEAGDVKVDAMEPVVVRNNFFEEKSGWGLDMDDGASNYEITNNISKGVSVKLREGAYRTVHNNIWFDTAVAPCFHVGNEQNHDRYFHNITVMRGDDVYSIIAPPARGPWLEEIDGNCFFNRSGKFSARVTQMRGPEGPERGVRRYDLEGWRRLGFDRHSVYGDPLFVNPAANDFRVRPESPALRVGFKNFEMGNWGITKDFPAAWASIGADAGSPVIKDYGLREYVRLSKDLPHAEDTAWKLVCEMPYNCQFQPWIEAEGPPGRTIRFNSSNPLVLYLTPTETATTAPGVRTYEAKNWVSGEGAIYTIPAGVTVKAVKYRETGYDTEFAGSFECSDEDYNILWRKGARTVYLCMRDHSYDCPDRERVGFWGDGTPELDQCFYLFDARAHRLCRDLVLRNLEPDFYPGQILEFLGEYGLWFYYMQTGDLDSLRAVYDATKTFLFETYKFGNPRQWFDWGKRSKDTAVIETCFYSIDLQTLRKIALATGHEADLPAIDVRLAAIRATFDARFWTGTAYMSAQVSVPDDRANAMAVNAGLAGRDKWAAIYDNVLARTANASCFFDRWVFEALCAMGRPAEALIRMSTRYRTMIPASFTTLWEHYDRWWASEIDAFDEGSSLNHGWNPPVLNLSQTIAGVGPEAPGWTTFHVLPQEAFLTSIKAVVPSIRGPVAIAISKTEAAYSLTVTVPAGTTAVVGIPRASFSSLTSVEANGRVVWDGLFRGGVEGVTWNGEDDRYLKFNAAPGTWKFVGRGTLPIVSPKPSARSPMNEEALDKKTWTASASVPDGQFLFSGDKIPIDIAAGNALDGDHWTGWRDMTRTQYPGQWFEVNMGRGQTFRKIVLDNTWALWDSPKAYAVSVSDDGVHWSVPIAAGAGELGITTVTFPAQTARYIRITQTGSDAAYHWSIYEMDVYR